MKTFTKLLYAFFGLLFLSAGAALVSYKSGILPVNLETRIFHAAENNLNSLHLLQEFGALMVFAGLLSFWFIKDYEQSKKFHIAMTVFWALMAIIHWTDVLHSGAPLVYAFINTVPLLLFAVTGVMRKN